MCPQNAVWVSGTLPSRQFWTVPGWRGVREEQTGVGRSLDTTKCRCPGAAERHFSATATRERSHRGQNTGPLRRWEDRPWLSACRFSGFMLEPLHSNSTETTGSSCSPVGTSAPSGETDKWTSQDWTSNWYNLFLWCHKSGPFHHLKPQTLWKKD